MRFSMVFTVGLKQCEHIYGRLLAGSLALSIFTYLFVNMGMVIGLLPVVGLPLPLMSYGGTSVLTVMMAMGLLLNVNLRRTVF